jgi:AraC-like DNA-binding protein
VKPTTQEVACREAAAASALNLVRQDRRRVSPSLKAVLQFLEAHLFDPGLTVGQWLRGCNVPRKAAVRFGQEVGDRPHAYLSKLRTATAKNLLKDTPLDVWRVGRLVGYSSQTSFERAFRRVVGCSPSGYRRQYQKVPPPGPGYKKELEVMRSWRMAYASPSTAQVGTALVEQLCRHYPFLRSRWATGLPAADGFTIGGTLYERLRAERVWQSLKGLHFGDQKVLLGLQVSFETMALFDLLREKSLEAARQDRQRGLKLAELARFSIEACGPTSARVSAAASQWDQHAGLHPSWLEET